MDLAYLPGVVSEVQSEGVTIISVTSEWEVCTEAGVWTYIPCAEASLISEVHLSALYDYKERSEGRTKRVISRLT